MQIRNIMDDMASFTEVAENLGDVSEQLDRAVTTADGAKALADANAVRLDGMYTKAQVDALIAEAERFSVQAVTELPSTGTTAVLYILTSETPNGMYIWQDGVYTKVGNMGMEVKVDTELDDTSTNAVQNKVITSRIRAIEETHASDMETVNGDISDLQSNLDNAVDMVASNTTKADSAIEAANTANATATEALDMASDLGTTKQDKLTAGTNIVIENNVISSVAGGQSVTIDTSMSETSGNPVANSTITTVLKNFENVITRMGSQREEADNEIIARITPLETASADHETRITKNTTDIATKQPLLSAGTGISISDNVISCTVEGSGTITVDTAMSSTSTNPVQNKVVNTELTSIRSDLSDLESAVGDHATTVTNLGYNVSSLSTQVSGFEDSISSLESDISSLDSAKQAKITGGASTIATTNLTSNRALVSNSSGKVAVSVVTSTELNYLTGLTEHVQDAIDELRGSVTGDNGTFQWGYVGTLTEGDTSKVSFPQTVTFDQVFQAVPMVICQGFWDGTTAKGHPVQVDSVTQKGFIMRSGADWNGVMWVAIGKV